MCESVMSDESMPAYACILCQAVCIAAFTGLFQDVARRIRYMTVHFSFFSVSLLGFCGGVASV